MISNLQTFSNVPDFIHFIESSSCDILIFLIISGQLGENHVSNLHVYSKICHIYVYCVSRQKHGSWIDKHEKIRDIYINRDCLLKQLMADVTLYSKSLSAPITLFKRDELIQKETSIRNLSKERAIFIWYQLLFEIVLGSAPSIKARREILNEFKQAYQNNAIELQKISEFELNYSPKTALRWYTRNCFLFRLVNKSMRTQNIVEIYKYRWFIRDLHEQLSQLHSIQSATLAFSKVYRGQLISFEELEQIRSNIQGLISLNTYFSTSINKDVADEFCGGGLARPNYESIVFTINIKPNVTMKPFASIREFSYMQDENEVLFSAGTVFRIIVVHEPNNGIWSVELELNSDIEQDWDEFMRYMRTEMLERPTLFTMGNFLSEMGDLEKAEQYYRLLINELEHENDMGAILTAIAGVHYRKSNYSTAIRYCDDGLKRLINLPETHPDLATAYNLRGMIHYDMDQLDDAMRCYEHAFHIHEQTLPSNDPFIASDLNNIASVDSKAHRFNQASKRFEQVLKIKLSILPKDHPSIARTYVNMGRLYAEQRNWIVALNFYDKALVIQQKILPITHPDLSITYVNKAHIFIEQKNFDIARQFCKQALDIQLITVPLNSNYLANTYSLLATIDSQTGKRMQALYALEKALQFEQDCHISWERICHLQNRIGDIHIKNGDYQLALKSFMEALDSIPATKRDLLRFSTCNNIATVYHNTGNYRMALQYYHQSMDYLNTMSIPPSNVNLLLFYQNIGLSYSATEQYDLALEYFARVFSLTDEASIIAKNFSNMGDALFHKQDYDEALQNYELALNHYPVNGSARAATYNSIGMTHQLLEDVPRALNSYHQAIYILQTIECTNRDEELAAVYSNIANAYLKIGNLSEAKIHFRKQLEYEADEHSKREVEQILANL
ncbi:unnamed protein product [Rotaria sp. Silwood2]|nr:unnamed protein product [Rotaria sp. Silwood2]